MQPINKLFIFVSAPLPRLRSKGMRITHYILIKRHRNLPSGTDSIDFGLLHSAINFKTSLSTRKLFTRVTRENIFSALPKLYFYKKKTLQTLKKLNYKYL